MPTLMERNNRFEPDSRQLRLSSPTEEAHALGAWQCQFESDGSYQTWRGNPIADGDNLENC
jgi:hypothetical protein